MKLGTFLMFKLNLYNFTTKTKEHFAPHLDQKINIYVCGPTVYSDLHIGNYRALIMFDVLIRLLKFKQHQVNYIVNITDIDDKIIAAALEQNVPETTITDKYANLFVQQFSQLNLQPANHFPRVTNYIPQIKKFIDQLITKKQAYISHGNIYFDTSAYTSYGQHSNRKLDQNIAQNNKGSEKKNSNDFALWKNTTSGVKWPSKHGEGRPGWHTECAVLAHEFSTKMPLDIHGGGVDLIFPHHENEIAQYQACNQQQFSKMWMYVGHVSLADVKMSKSLKNTILLKDFLIQWSANNLRYIYLNTSYLKPLDVQEDLFYQTSKLLNKYQRCFNLMNSLYPEIFNLGKTKSLSNIYQENKNNQSLNLFLKYLHDNLNTANCLTMIHQIYKNLNKLLQQDIALHSAQYQLLCETWFSLCFMWRLLGFMI